jgi:hypothetical protein
LEPLAESVIKLDESDQLYAIHHTARILRGLRIAARLGLSLSKDTATAIHNYSSSVQGLGKVVAKDLNEITILNELCH